MMISSQALCSQRSDRLLADPRHTRHEHKCALQKYQLRRSVVACHLNHSIVVSASHADAPWIAAHLAVLHEAAADVRLNVRFPAARRNRDT